MTTPIVKTLIDEQVDELTLDAALQLPRETLVRDLRKPVKGAWVLSEPHLLRDNSAFMEGSWGIDPRGRLVEL
jgi:hypothetical protein